MPTKPPINWKRLPPNESTGCFYLEDFENFEEFIKRRFEFQIDKQLLKIMLDYARWEDNERRLYKNEGRSSNDGEVIYYETDINGFFNEGLLLVLRAHEISLWLKVIPEGRITLNTILEADSLEKKQLFYSFRSENDQRFVHKTKPPVSSLTYIRDELLRRVGRKDEAPSYLSPQVQKHLIQDLQVSPLETKDISFLAQAYFFQNLIFRLQAGGGVFNDKHLELVQEYIKTLGDDDQHKMSVNLLQKTVEQITSPTKDYNEKTFMQAQERMASFKLNKEKTMGFREICKVFARIKSREAKESTGIGFDSRIFDGEEITLSSVRYSITQLLNHIETVEELEATETILYDEKELRKKIKYHLCSYINDEALATTLADQMLEAGIVSISLYASLLKMYDYVLDFYQEQAPEKKRIDELAEADKIFVIACRAIGLELAEKDKGREQLLKKAGSAYRRRALKFHPDKNKAEGAEAAFKEMLDNYEIVTKYLEKHETDNLWQLFSNSETATHENKKSVSAPAFKAEFNKVVKDTKWSIGPLGFGFFGGRSLEDGKKVPTHVSEMLAAKDQKAIKNIAKKALKNPAWFRANNTKKFYETCAEGNVSEALKQLSL